MLELHDILKIVLDRVKEKLPYYEITKRLGIGEAIFWKIRTGERNLSLPKFRSLITLLVDFGYTTEAAMLLEFLGGGAFKVVPREQESNRNAIKDTCEFIRKSGESLQVAAAAIQDGKITPLERKEMLSVISDLEDALEKLKTSLREG